MKIIPIFIVTFNKLEVLKKSIASYYKNIGTPFQIVIHDNTSDYPPLLEYFEELKKNGVDVYYNDKNDAFESVHKTVDDWFEKNSSVADDYYVVTDPDIQLENTNPDILMYYKYLLLLNKSFMVPDKYSGELTHQEVYGVGPMLRIDDIPDHYPLKGEAIQRHYEQFWSKIPLSVTWMQRQYNYLPCFIDSTFAMYHKSFKFKNHNFAMRTHAPYSARHLDWYIDTKNPTEDELYYYKTARGFVNWSSGHGKEMGLKMKDDKDE